ncbi:hypothetical protein [Chamaesiphon sp. OTE_8_metabat_110]|uniref:hypothetical protein n=1 Tax=Chamaesiphon sp. OTE_8_metabat_110 TaxID=2964696 RepID=UPI00286D041B|nr:hypothetical protein [Chamaesiphon sp. OTE_8_metabat_110]
MFDPVSTSEVVRVISSAYLLSSCFLLSFTTFGWWTISHLERQDLHLPRWFS